MNQNNSQIVAEVFGKLDEPFLKHLLELRRWLHQHPELSFQEVNTAKRIIEELEHLGIEYSYAGIGHSVIADIKGKNSSAAIIALRAEMDALPGDETTGASYSSVNPGRMHACGHCAHMAMLVGAATLLTRDPPEGDVRLIFQPAEEWGGGSRVAIEDGALTDVAGIFAVHVTQAYKTGEFMIRDGLITSQSDRFTIKIRGKGGHGARPHEAIDAVVISSSLITALQTIVSREVNPLDTSVVTIGKVRAGSAANVIAEKATLQGTIRTTRARVRKNIHRGMKRMASAVAELHGAKISLKIKKGNPPVINEPVFTQIARDAAAETVGSRSIVASRFPSMGSEDFSYYLENVPGCFVRLGARTHDQEPIPLHSPAFDIDERVLGIGALFFDRAARLAHESIKSNLTLQE